MLWILVPFITAFGMIGGQRFKAIRRYGIPAAGVLVQALEDMKTRKEKMKYLSFVLMTGILSMGYGVNSWLMKVCKTDWAVRIVYGLILALPFFIVQNWWAVLLPGAYSIRAGSFKIGKYDWLWEDAIRYTTLGILIVLTIRS